MSHMAYMNFGRVEMAVSQIPCPCPEVVDVPIVVADWASSRLSGIYKSGAILRSVHANMYNTLMGYPNFFR